MVVCRDWRLSFLSFNGIFSGSYSKLQSFQPKVGVTYKFSSSTVLMDAGYSVHTLLKTIINGKEYVFFNQDQIKPEKEVISQFKLMPSYPNPFNAQVTIPFDLSKTSNVSIEIYDLRGWLIEDIFDEQLKPGEYSVKWNTKDASSGLYLYKVVIDNKSMYGKCLLIK